MKTLARYTIFFMIGMVLHAAGYDPFDWQWWALGVPLFISVHAHAWAMSA